MKENYIYILATLFLFCVVGIVVFISRNKPLDISNEILVVSEEFKTNYASRQEAAVKLIPHLKIGMTSSEVETILGKPDSTKESGGILFWNYSLFYSQFINIQFNSEGRIQKIQACAPGLGNDSSGSYVLEGK